PQGPRMFEAAHGNAPAIPATLQAPGQPGAAVPGQVAAPAPKTTAMPATAAAAQGPGSSPNTVAGAQGPGPSPNIVGGAHGAAAVTRVPTTSLTPGAVRQAEVRALNYLNLNEGRAAAARPTGPPPVQQARQGAVSWTVIRGGAGAATSAASTSTRSI